jgi:hypothetical protein
VQAPLLRAERTYIAARAASSDAADEGADVVHPIRPLMRARCSYGRIHVPFLLAETSRVSVPSVPLRTLLYIWSNDLTRWRVSSIDIALAECWKAVEVVERRCAARHGQWKLSHCVYR